MKAINYNCKIQNTRILMHLTVQVHSRLLQYYANVHHPLFTGLNILKLSITANYKIPKFSMQTDGTKTHQAYTILCQCTSSTIYWIEYTNIKHNCK